MLSWEVCVGTPMLSILGMLGSHGNPHQPSTRSDHYLESLSPPLPGCNELRNSVTLFFSRLFSGICSGIFTIYLLESREIGDCHPQIQDVTVKLHDESPNYQSPKKSFPIVKIFTSLLKGNSELTWTEIYRTENCTQPSITMTSTSTDSTRDKMHLDKASKLNMYNLLSRYQYSTSNER